MALRTMVMLVAFVASLPICFMRPFYGVLMWTIVAFVNPQSYLWSSRNIFPWAEAVAIPTLAGLVFFSRGWTSRVASRESFLLLTLWMWFTITSFASINTPLFLHHATETRFRWELVSKILLMTVVTIALVKTFTQLRILLLVIAGCFGLFIVKALPFIVLTGGSFRLYGPPGSMIADNNDFGLALNMTFPMFFFFAQTEAKRWMRWLSRGLAIIVIPAIFFTYSRGALLGLGAIGLFIIAQSRARVAIAPVIGLGLAVAILFAPVSWKNRMDPSQSLDASGASRLNAWTFAWNLANDYPITGGGFDTFTPELFDRYAPTSIDVKGPHSIYFGVLGEHGFVGLLLYLALVVSCWLTTGRICKQARSFGDHTALCYANMLRFSLVGFLVSGAFLGRAYFDYFFTIVACVAILKRVCEAQWFSADFDDVESVEAPLLNNYEAHISQQAL